MRIRRFGCFCIVGVIGFCVDLLLFYLGLSLVGWSPIVARLVAFPFAATTTWIGNRKLTFHDRPCYGIAKQWQRALLVAVASFAVNMSVFSLVTTWLGAYEYAAYLALVAGIAAGLVSNYGFNVFWVFRTRSAGYQTG